MGGRAGGGARPHREPVTATLAVRQGRSGGRGVLAGRSWWRWPTRAGSAGYRAASRPRSPRRAAGWARRSRPRSSWAPARSSSGWVGRPAPMVARACWPPSGRGCSTPTVTTCPTVGPRWPVWTWSTSPGSTRAWRPRFSPSPPTWTTRCSGRPVRQRSMPRRRVRRRMTSPHSRPPSPTGPTWWRPPSPSHPPVQDRPIGQSCPSRPNPAVGPDRPTGRMCPSSRGAGRPVGSGSPCSRCSVRSGARASTSCSTSSGSTPPWPVPTCSSPVRAPSTSRPSRARRFPGWRGGRAHPASRPWQCAGSAASTPTAWRRSGCGRPTRSPTSSPTRNGRSHTRQTCCGTPVVA